MKRKSTINYLLALIAAIILFGNQGCKNQGVAPVSSTTPVTISAVSPISGSTVTITGTKFDLAAANNIVKFDGVAVNVISATETSLTVAAPTSGHPGIVTVTNSAGTFTWPLLMPPPPTITSISPSAGDVYALVTIKGTHFKTTPAANTVKFNGVAAMVQTATVTQLNVLAPAGGSTGMVTVTTTDGTATGPIFTYVKHVVYVLGSTASGFCYWKNGVRTDLPSDAQGLNCSVTSLFVSGTDVYVGGTALNQAPAYWKNAAAAVLLPTNSQTGYVSSIYVSGATVYTCGGLYNPFNSQYTLVYWQNQTLNYLLNPSGTQGISGLAADMTMSGADLYISGNLSVNSGNSQNAAYWKNGTPTVLTSVTSGSANGIFITPAGDLYLAGAESGVSKYWKNGVATLLSPSPTNSGPQPGRKIFVSASGTVYVLARSNGAANYWKNGAMVSLTDQEFNGGVTTCVNGLGNNIYIGGSSDGVNNVWGYWVNGQFITLPNATNVYDIIVK